MLILRNPLEHYAVAPLTMAPLQDGENQHFSFRVTETEKHWAGYKLKPSCTYVCHLTNQRLILEPYDPTLSSTEPIAPVCQIPYDAIKSFKLVRSLNTATYAQVVFKSPLPGVKGDNLTLGVGVIKPGKLPLEKQHCAADFVTLGNELFQSDDQFLQEVQASPVPVVVHFWAQGCEPCRAFAPVVDEMAVQFGNQIKLIKVNMDEDMHFPIRYGVDGVPTVLVFKAGSIVNRINGAIPSALLTKVLKRYV